jgi:hypothetical protein
MITCKEVSQEAHEFLDGEMTLSRRLNLITHLVICKHCRRYIKELRLTLRALQDTEILEEDTVPTDAEIDDIVEKLKKANP